MFARPTSSSGLRIGDVTIDRVIEMLGPVREPAAMFPAWSEDVWTRELPWMAPDYVDPVSGRYISSIQSWVLRRPSGATVLIDACAGNGRTREHAPRYHLLSSNYVEDLFSLGVAREAVDLVILTHLHEDHVGWCTRWSGRSWRPMFPNARHLVSRVELDAFMARAQNPMSLDDSNFILADSIAPLIDAGLIETFDPPFVAAPGLTLEAAPGHTAGQCVVRLVVDREEVLFTADVMHHPIQIVRPDWNTRYCELPEVAAATRHAILKDAADRGVVLAPGHFGQRHLTRIHRDGYGFYPVFIGADDMAAAS